MSQVLCGPFFCVCFGLLSQFDKIWGVVKAWALDPCPSSLVNEWVENREFVGKLQFFPLD